MERSLIVGITDHCSVPRSDYAAAARHMLLIACFIFTILADAAASAVDLTLPLVSDSSSALPVVYNGTGSALLSFRLKPRSHFAFLTVNDVGASVSVQIAGAAISVVPATMFLSSHPDYADFVIRSCGSADPCHITLNVTAPASTTPIQVRGQQGTVLGLSEDQRAHLDGPEQTRMYGLYLRDDALPALISMSPITADDFDITVYTLQMSGFTQQFPGGPSHQQNAHNNGPEKVLVQNLASTFVRVDVTLRTPSAGDYILRLYPNYDAFDLYQLSLAGTIGAACLLAMCLLASVCVIVAKRSAARGAALLELGGPIPGLRGLSAADIDAGTEKKKAVDLSLSVDDNMCVICLDEYEGPDDLRVLPCSHHFHSECIVKWFDEHKHCPLCHREVPESPAVAPNVV